MFKQLKTIFKRSNEVKEMYAWKTIDKSELDQYPNAINDIYSNKYVGIIIRNVFSSEEVALMKDKVEGMDRNTMIPTGVGFSYPKHFAQLVRPIDKKPVTEKAIVDYFAECENLQNTMKDILGVDFKERIEGVFKQLASGKNVQVPKGYDNKGNYAFGSIRLNLAGKGFISIHCGNYFQQEFPDFYQHLSTQVNVKNQLSYFVTVNEAEKGGELSLFDLIWEDGQTKIHPGEDNEVILKSGDKLDVGRNSNIKKQMIKPGAGDLLIFSGGPIWHRVELVEGKENRITIGGFLANDKVGESIMYWT